MIERKIANNVCRVCILLLLSGAPASAGEVFWESFSYPDGPLAGNGMWQGDAANGTVLVDGGRLRLYGDSALDKTWVAGLGIDGGEHGVVDVSVTVARGSNVAGEGFNRWWVLALYDDNDLSLGGWAGVDNEITTYDPSFTSSSAVSRDLTGTADFIRVEVDFSQSKTRFFFNEQLMASYLVTPGGHALDKLEFRWDNDDADGQTILFDDLRVVPEPCTTMLLILGGFALVVRRSRRLSDTLVGCVG